MMMMTLPKLSYTDEVKLKQIMERFPEEFWSDKTKFLIKEMDKFIEDSMVWRTSIKGLTRIGKSEIAQTLCMQYRRKFNDCMNKGFYDDIIKEISGKSERYSIDFKTEHILAGQSDYLYTLQEREKKKTLQFGQIWQIDEQKGSVGGAGSYTEFEMLKNVNNIIAKFMQSEIWIRPDGFMSRNSPYGIHAWKKDIKRKINFGMLFSIEQLSQFSSTTQFLGWVAIPMHTDEDLRKSYNLKKNEWIKNEIKGNVDIRSNERMKVADKLAQDPVFSQVSEKGYFVFNKQQQVSLLERWVAKGKTGFWNETEKWRIVDEARMLLIEKNIAKQHTKTKKK